MECEFDYDDDDDDDDDGWKLESLPSFTFNDNFDGM